MKPSMDFYDVVRTTPATRQFDPKPVPDSVLFRILDHARFAPSGGNRQGWRVVVVKDQAIREKIRDHYVLAWREYMAHVQAGIVPFAPVDGNWDGPAVDLVQARQIDQPNPFGDHLDQVPVMLVICVELGALAVLDNGLGRQSIVGGGSIYPFAHNILLGARNEGLGGVMTTVLCREEAPVMELLHVPHGWALAGLVALGRPAQVVTKLSRRAVEDITFIDRFGGEPLRGDT